MIFNYFNYFDLVMRASSLLAFRCYFELPSINKDFTSLHFTSLHFTAFMIATTMCLFHLLCQTAFTGIFWYRVKNHSIAKATDVVRAKDCSSWRTELSLMSLLEVTSCRVFGSRDLVRSLSWWLKFIVYDVALGLNACLNPLIYAWRHEKFTNGKVKSSAS